MKTKKVLQNFLATPFLQTISKIYNLANKRRGVTAFFAIIFCLWIILITFGSKRYVDESYHYRQVKYFHTSRFEIIEGLTTIPGYHAALSLIVYPFDDLSFLKIRLVSLAIAILIIPLFYYLAKELAFKDPLSKTLTFTLLPIAFIYYPLIYTDIFSTLLVLLSLYLALKQRYTYAAIASVFSIATRQNNIIWHLFVWIYPYFVLHGFSFTRKLFFQYIRSTFGFFLGTLLFALFVIINGSIAVGDKQSHQAGFYLGNIFFFLAISGIVFWPFVIGYIAKIKKFTKDKRFWIALFISSLVAAILLFFPPVLHGYNTSPKFIRNIFLMFSYNGHLWVYSILVFLGTLSLFAIKFHRNISYLIYPFIFLYLMPSWLIEQRYSIIPLALILLFRKEQGKFTETFTRIYYLLICISLILTILVYKIFF